MKSPLHFKNITLQNYSQLLKCFREGKGNLCLNKLGILRILKAGVNSYVMLVFKSSPAVMWLKHCRCGVKHYSINQSINQSINPSVNQFIFILCFNCFVRSATNK